MATDPAARTVLVTWDHLGEPAWVKAQRLQAADLYTKTWKHIAGPKPGYMPRPMRMGRRGFMINCAGCNREFDCGNGLRCCSRECERALKNRNETTELLDSVGMERPTKRKCEGCGGDIPNWTGEGKARKRTRSNTRFCSPKCRQRRRT